MRSEQQRVFSSTSPTANASHHSHCLQNLLNLLRLDHLDRPDHDDEMRFLSIDPADPMIENICLLTDQLSYHFDAFVADSPSPTTAAIKAAA